MDNQKEKVADNQKEKVAIISQDDSPPEEKENDVSWMFETCCAAANAYFLTFSFLKTAETYK